MRATYPDARNLSG